MTLPSWNLSDLYSGIDDEKIKSDLEKIKNLNFELASKYKGKISNLSSSDFLLAIKNYEEIVILSHLLNGFAYLNMATQMNNEKATSFYQSISEQLTEYSKPSIFFTLEINNLSEEKLQEFLLDKEVFVYKPWIDRLRLFKPYELSEEAESIFVDKDITSRSAWVRLYDEHCVALKYNVDGKDYNDAEITNLTQSKDKSIRHKAGAEINRVCQENSKLFSFIYNMIIKDKAIEDNRRGFKTPLSSMCLSNNVEEDVVHNLANSVKSNYANISHRFYKLKAKWLGVDKLDYWDRNAPLPFDCDIKYSWDDAVNIVLEAYKDFSPKLYNLAIDFFENDWIDVPPRQGKRNGAFAHPVSSAVHPYLFLNFTGKQRDVLTLAHELGHGCHMRLSLSQGELQDDTPLILAEVASVFGESLTFKKMLSSLDDDKAKLCLIASKVSDMIATAIRQISFHLFEMRAHELRKEGELSIQQLNDIWVDELKSSLGEYVDINANSDHVWAQISHFFHVPFYVYAYSFADCTVNSLFSLYQSGKVDGFEDKYFKFLSETGTRKYDDLLSDFNLDATDNNFWNMGLKVISDYIDELEILDKKIFG